MERIKSCRLISNKNELILNMFGMTEIHKEDRPWAPATLAEDASGINTMMRKKQNKDNGLTH